MSVLVLDIECEILQKKHLDHFVVFRSKVYESMEKVLMIGIKHLNGKILDINGLVLIALVITSAVSSSCFAQAGPGYSVDLRTQSMHAEKSRNLSTPGNEFGDYVDLQSGKLGLTVVDVSIPGNFNIPVEFRRSYAPRDLSSPPTNPAVVKADWIIDIPRIRSSHLGVWKTSDSSRPNKNCSVTSEGFIRPPNFVSGPLTVFRSETFWRPAEVNMLGRSETLLYNKSLLSQPSAGGPYFWNTKSGSYASCIGQLANPLGVTAEENNIRAIEGFLLTTSDGTKYRFDWIAVSDYSNISTAWTYASFNEGVVEYSLYPTRIEDLNGNWVNYSYSNKSNESVKLDYIESSDGRRIDIAYNATTRRFSSVSSHGRAWSYSWNAASGQLQSVSNPDGSNWQYSGSGGVGNVVYNSQSYPQGCRNGDLRKNPDTTLGAVAYQSGYSVKSPSGATALFGLTRLVTGRSGVPMTCILVADPADDFAALDDINYLKSEIWALTYKRISGPGLSDLIWRYAYLPEIGLSTSSNSGILARILSPDGSRYEYTFGNRYRSDEGLLLNEAVYRSDGVLLESKVNSYETGSGDPQYPKQIGFNPSLTGQGYEDSYFRPLKSALTSRQGVNFSRIVSSTDSWARPISVSVSSTISGNPVRSSIYQYHDNLSKWVLGQVASSTNTNTGLVEYATTYDATTALPLQTYAFGKLQQTLTYNANGTVATVKDGNNNVTTLSVWKRGIPQTVQHPATPEATAGAIQSAVVDNNGWITSVTDENGFTTSYTYDAMGRLKDTIYPTGDTTVWHTTTRVFEPVAAAEYGIPAGHWRQTVSTGNARKITYFDGLWRPLVTREYDTAAEATTQRFQRFTYDHDGRVVFSSYPGLTDTLTTGVWSTYDTLGRSTSVSQDSEHGLLTTLTEYVSGFRTITTNPRLLKTTTEYQAFDQPTYSSPTGLTTNADTVTEIHRDVFGKVTSLVRRNHVNSVRVDRTYAYNTFQELCRSVEPETGATLMGYDGAGNVTWSASGLPASTSCNGAETNPTVTARRLVRTYDARNRVRTMVQPDGIGNQAWTYTPDSLTESIVRYNAAAGGEAVVNGYGYNRRRLLTAESLGQPGWYTWYVNYGYDQNAGLSSQSYPEGGGWLFFAPNALGQATRVENQIGEVFASGAQYHPNGALKQFTYGNGITHSVQLNARQLPSRIMDSGVSDQDIRYDASGNVTEIYDLARGSHYNRHMQYDSLDRLTGAGAWSFGGTDGWHRFTYNALDNLKSWKHAGVKDYAEYFYDGSNRLSNIVNSANATVEAFGYDVQGNIANKSGQLYWFNYDNRLRSLPGKEYYRYDGLGRRALAWRPTSGSFLSQYTRDGKIYYQWDDVQRKRIFHVYLGNTLVMTREGAVDTGISITRYQHTDALGSPIAKTSPTGAVIERNEYEPYGAVIGKPNYDGVGYTGHVQDGATGLTYMQQRYYDPQIGLFLSVDPVTAYSNPVGQFHRYRYANNNPYKFTDPDGREVRAVNPSDRVRIENMVNSKAVGVYKFNSAGSLQQVRSTGDSSRFSQYYSDRLNQAIASDNTINVRIGDTYQNASTGETVNVVGGLTQALGNGLSDQNVVVTGKSYTGDMKTSTGAPLTQTPSTILMHEMVGHAIPGAVGSDTGNAVSNENKVRIQLPDADLRMRDERHIE